LYNTIRLAAVDGLTAWLWRDALLTVGIGVVPFWEGELRGILIFEGIELKATDGSVPA
jgi:hypothetical protein